MNQKEIRNNETKSELKNFIIHWNNSFPIDRWWRVKHNIPFGSIEHKSCNFIQMMLEYEEDKMINLMHSKESEDEEPEFMRSGETKVTKQEIDNDFEDLDLDEFNDQ